MGQTRLIAMAGAVGLCFSLLISCASSFVKERRQTLLEQLEAGKVSKEEYAKQYIELHKELAQSPEEDLYVAYSRLIMQLWLNEKITNEQMHYLLTERNIQLQRQLTARRADALEGLGRGLQEAGKALQGTQSQSRCQPVYVDGQYHFVCY